MQLFKWGKWIQLIGFFAFLAGSGLPAYGSEKAKSAQPDGLKIVDYQKRLNPKFVKKIRPQTRFIVIHSTESSLPSALRTLSRGKVYRGRTITHGGHAHFLIARNGTVYRILDPKYWANHAGVSMWDGAENLSDYSIGIELEGYHNIPFSDQQYRALRLLLPDLQKRYSIADRDVLEHYRIAYSKPNRYHRTNTRGRKLDPGKDNFDRERAGLEEAYPSDPDVLAGRISGPVMVASAAIPVEPEETDETDDEETEPDSSVPQAAPPAPLQAETNMVSLQNTPWHIAGPKYKAPTTVYKFPDGQLLRGDQITDWSNIPAGTEVQLDVVGAPPRKVVTAQSAEVKVPEIGPQMSAWKISNALYNSAMTVYLFPDGSVRTGNRIADFSALPAKTRVLAAYRPMPLPITRSPLGEDLRDIYLSSHTLYLFPDKSLKSGEQIEDFSTLPAATRVFAKLD